MKKLIALLCFIPTFAFSQVYVPAPPPPLSAVTASIGGAALIAGACTSGTVSVSGASTSMVALTDPNTYPGDGVVYSAYISSPGIVTVKVCAIIGLTPTASTYNVRVIQ
ncbi:MAG: hypothetical protein KGI54_15915 [Pseudomonadota bacterium]|nr:hypothetical protein [Pseudomonadota bacterium]